MRLHFPRIGLFQLRVEKKRKADLNERPNQSRLACLPQRKSRPPVHPGDEPIAWRHFVFLKWHQNDNCANTFLIMPLNLLSLSTTAWVQVQLEDNYNWIFIFSYFFMFFPAVREWQQHFYCLQVPRPDSQDTVCPAFPLTIKLMVQYIYFSQNWLEDKTLMNNASGKAHWNHWCEFCSRRFPITCSCFHRSQHGREQQQTVPLPPLCCYCWSWFQNAQSPTARNTINYSEGRWWKQTGTDHHITVL